MLLNQLIDLLASSAYTPDGGVADPNHPVYALIYGMALDERIHLPSSLRYSAR